MGNLEDSNATNSADETLVALADTAQLDAFGRLRTSHAVTIFDSTFKYDKQPVLWNESVVSGGTVTHDANKVSVVLACTTTTNSEAIFQTRQYFRYKPSKSQFLVFTGNFISTATKVVKKIGYFDANNGLFFQLSGSTLSVVRRTKVSGAVVNNTTNQSSWNLDKLDGTGASGLTIDVTKQQIFIIDFQWLGSGRIRYGFNIGGVIVYCHEESNANTLTVPYSQTADLPVRVEIKNNSATASSMHITCVAVASESGYAPEGIIRTVSNGTTARSFAGAGSTIPILSIRKQTAYVDLPVKIIDFTAFSNTTDDFLIRIVYNGTLTGASWVNASGFAQYDVSSTAISGGTYIYSMYLRGASGSVGSIADIFQQISNATLGRDISGNSDILSIVGINITSAASLFGVINYRELL